MKIRIGCRHRRKQDKSRLLNRKHKNGQQGAKQTDERLRRLLIPTPGGVREVLARGSEEASRLGEYWATVQKYFHTGDDSALLKFKDKAFTDASGNRHVFRTDPKQLNRQASAGTRDGGISHGKNKSRRAGRKK